MNREVFFKSGAFCRLGNDQWVVSWGDFTRVKQPKEAEVSYYVADFFEEIEDPWVRFDNNSVISTAELQKVLEHQPNPQMRSVAELKVLAGLAGGATGFKLANWDWQPAGQQEFQELFTLAMDNIKNGGFKKVVPVTFEKTSETPDADLLGKVLHKLLASNERIYPYGFWEAGNGFIGVTPEVLFKKHKTLVNTMALAGTRANDSKKSLLEDPKELSENKIVVDSLVASLSAFGEVNISETEEYNIGPLTHLKTDVQLSLKSDITPDELIKSLHPTPALGGEPRDIAVDWLKENNRQEFRKSFGSPFAVQINSEEVLALVAIRNIAWTDSETYLFSGCGLVEGSQFDSEWNELQHKRNSVKEFLGL